MMKLNTPQFDPNVTPYIYGGKLDVRAWQSNHWSKFFHSAYGVLSVVSGVMFLWSVIESLPSHRVLRSSGRSASVSERLTAVQNMHHFEILSLIFILIFLILIGIYWRLHPTPELVTESSKKWWTEAKKEGLGKTYVAAQIVSYVFVIAALFLLNFQYEPVARSMNDTLQNATLFSLVMCSVTSMPWSFWLMGYLKRHPYPRFVPVGDTVSGSVG